MLAFYKGQIVEIDSIFNFGHFRVSEDDLRKSFQAAGYTDTNPDCY
jgi:hypothetical protein